MTILVSNCVSICFMHFLIIVYSILYLFHINHGSITSTANLTSNIVEQTSPGDIILLWSIQKQLQIVCNRLRIPEPTYTLHEAIVDHGIQYVRYYACTSTPLITTQPCCIGGFATSDYDAKEDAVVLLLRHILSTTGRKIRDFNYYKVQQIEEQLKNSVYENFQLRKEIASLKA
ncbi:hypothetical protein P8452_52578 [Trifolium repens]|nr:hypothetical protein P8452_52578 [Trifolium repens]